MVARDETILGNPFVYDDVRGCDSGDGSFPDDHPSKVSVREIDYADATDDGDNRAGMDMGLLLFGTSDAYEKQMEEEFRNKLRGVERELEDIKRGLGHWQTRGDSLGNTIDDDDEEEEEEYPMEPTTATTNDSNGSCHSIDEIPQLQNHIQFLQECTQARKFLDEINALSLTTNFATAECSSGGNGIEGVSDGTKVIFPFSPSSILPSPCSSVFSVRRFTFESDTAKSLHGNEDGASPMVQAARMVKEVGGILEKMTSYLNEELVGTGVVDASLDDRRTTTNDNENSNVMQMHAKILNELRQEMRRKKMELRHRAMTLLEGCILIEEGRILVRGSGTANICNSTANGNDAPLKMESPSSMKGPMSTLPTNSTPVDSDSHMTPKNSNSIPPSPLSDAYQVLQLFSDSRFATFGETLDRAMKVLSQKLMDAAFRPCCNELELHWNPKPTADKSSAKGEDERSTSQVGFFNWKQDSVADGRSSVAGAGRRGGNLPWSSSAGRRYDPVTIKGPVVRLEWTLSTMTFSSLFENEHDEHDNDIIQHAATSISVASELTEEVLSMAPSPSFATFLSYLNCLTHLFSFLHHHVLLSRSDLAALLGKHLFGVYPLLTHDAISLSTGSAMLGGMLVGAAAQGEEEGEERPLMVEMIKGMRKWCVPEESRPEVWRKIPILQRFLVKEVAAFEERMVKMGFIDEGGGSHDSDWKSSKGRAGSSPTGLSLMLNHDDLVDSPMNKFLPSSNTSQSEPSTLTKSRKIFLSPLSEFAHSLPQAYIENKRSHILNHGRSILLTTDYHNTVQVGTFVPDPSEPGTLQSLDDDPLSAFIFHQCSISTTAQRILQLCRKTLDEATHPEAGKVLDALPPMLYRAARDLLDLFRAIIPTLYANEVGSIPRMAAVLHNDCVFLAHEASLLGEWIH